MISSSSAEVASILSSDYLDRTC